MVVRLLFDISVGTSFAKNGFCLTLRLISDHLNSFISTRGEEVVEGGEEEKITFSECH